ncbi:hypothetical protein SAMN05446635_2884 [Burkholderia sp. OK233]|nr:hypothetical protein SAMN05446635_2884 [Burkholderia sp. OK233]
MRASIRIRLIWLPNMPFSMTASGLTTNIGWQLNPRFVGDTSPSIAGSTNAPVMMPIESWTQVMHDKHCFLSL